MLVLGIETTCDESAAAVVDRRDDGTGEIVSNVVLSQTAHAEYGGVVPEIAARAHVEVIDMVIARAMIEAEMSFDRLDGMAAAAGPGLIGGVIVGLTTAKAIALVAEKPLIAVNHLEAHALTARLTDNVEFPYCLFLASGGHTQIVAVLGVGEYVRLGTTLDDALGEAFDKTAKLLGLPYPGGPAVELEAARGDAKRFFLPRPMVGRPEPDFSLSGLKTALRLEAEKSRALERPGRQRPVRLVPGRGGRDHHRPPAGRDAGVPRALRQADRAGGRRRRRGEPGDSPGHHPHGVRGRHADGGAARLAVHRQRRDHRLGRRRAARARPDRYARGEPARPLAAGGAARRRIIAVTFERIAVIGAGAWGTALAGCAARAGRSVTLSAATRQARLRSPEAARAGACPASRSRRRIAIGGAPAEAAGADAMLLAVPAQACRAVAAAFADHVAAGTVIVACAKGIERGTRRFMTEIIAEAAPQARPAILSGPSFAADVARGLPTAVTLAAARRGGRGRAMPGARLGAVPPLSLDRRARRRDRRRRQERAGDRGRESWRGAGSARAPRRR